MDLEKFNLPRYLATLPLFTSMREDELTRLATGCELRRMERGKLIFRTGDPCNEFHVPVLGQVKLFAISPAGTEKVIELCGPGHTFAEAVMFLGVPYVVSAQTLSDTLLLTVDKAVVLREIQFNPDFSLRMLAGLSRRLHGLIKDVEGYALHSGVQRVIGYLLGDRMTESDAASEAITVSLMWMSRLSTWIRPAVSSSLSTREKYSGVSDRREAMAALLTGSDTVMACDAFSVSSRLSSPSR